MVWEVILVLFVVAYLARWTAAGVRGRGSAELEPAHTAEIARLRDEVDQLTAQLAHLQDEQSFMMRLLAPGNAAEEGGAPPAAPAPDPKSQPENP